MAAVGQHGEQQRGTTIAAYGTWQSPITPDVLTQGAISFGEIALVGQDKRLVYIENRPVEKGRAAVVDIGSIDESHSSPTDLTRGDINARTAVHEYGGGALAASNLQGGSVIFASYKPGDYAVYRVKLEANKWSDPARITPVNEPMRYADFCVHPRNPDLILAVQEDHTIDEPSKVVNTLVLIDAQRHTVTTVAEGRDFYSSPRWSPDGRFIAWITWEHPEMPFWATEAWVASFDEASRRVADVKPVAGHKGKKAVVQQPIWMPVEASQQQVNTLVAFSDEVNGFIIPHKIRVESDAGGQLRLGDWQQVLRTPIEADFVKPVWTLNNSTVAALDGDALACSITRGSTDTLAILRISTGSLTEIDTPYRALHQVRKVSSTMIVANANSATEPSAIVSFDLSAALSSTARTTKLPSSAMRILKQSSDLISSGQISRSYLSEPIEVPFPTTLPPTGEPAIGHAILFPPRNPLYTAPRGTSPPCIFLIHGGPTSAASGGELKWQTNFWTSKGYAVCFVNYGGSTGYGREYMLRLNAKWGLVDVEDCVAAAKHLSSTGADEIQSGSGGLATSMMGAKGAAPRREAPLEMTRTARQQWEHLEEVYDTADGSVRVTMHRPESNWGWLDLVTTPLAAAASLALGRFAAANTTTTTAAGGFFASHPTATTAGVALAGMLAYLRLAKVRVLSETVFASPTLGLQSETRRGFLFGGGGSSRIRRRQWITSTERSPLIPRDRILDVVLNTAVSGWSIRDYLAVGVRARPRDQGLTTSSLSGGGAAASSSARQLQVLFPHLQPRLPIVERIHRALYPVLFPSSSNPVANAKQPIPQLRNNSPPTTMAGGTTSPGAAVPLVDPHKLIISGGSAGGYTVLASLTTHPHVFSAATCMFGVSDVLLLAQESHKFESMYPIQLMGGTPEEIPEVYKERSPIWKAGEIRTPLLVAQGTEDKVVPPNQSEMVVEAVKKRHAGEGKGEEHVAGKVKYLLFEGEGHGFRQKENVVKMLQEEEAWYRRTLRLG